MAHPAVTPHLSAVGLDARTASRRYRKLQRRLRIRKWFLERMDFRVVSWPAVYLDPPTRRAQLDSQPDAFICRCP